MVGVPEVQAIVDVVPEASAADNVAFAGSFLDAKAVGALAVLARVVIAVAGHICLYEEVSQGKLTYLSRFSTRLLLDSP